MSPAKSAAKKKTVKSARSIKKPAIRAVATKKLAAKKPLPTKTRAKRAARIDLPANYRPSEKEPYMNPSQLEYFRRKLLAWRKELLEESMETLNHLKEENWNEPDINDRATVETDTALELRTRDRYRKLISKIDAGLRKIENDEYGYCEETGDPIGLKRLEARPIATLTVAAQEKHEKYEEQYNDED